MDIVNFMMEEWQLPRMMRRRVRGFFLANKGAQQHKHQREIIDAMSPGLQGEVLLEMNRPWLSKVTFLNDLYEYGNTSEDHDAATANSIRSFVHEIARKMSQSLFCTRRTIGQAPRTLHTESGHSKQERKDLSFWYRLGSGFCVVRYLITSLSEISFFDVRC